MQEELEKLGFSIEEAKIYLALLEAGETTAGPIVKKTGLHRQVVYDNLEKLKNKDYISETIKSNRKNWHAQSPNQILGEIKRKETLVEKILPDLLSMQKYSAHKQEVKIFEGTEGFRIAHKNNVENQPRKSTVCVMGSTGWAWTKIMEKSKYLNKFEEQRMQKKIQFNVLFFEEEKKSLKKLVSTYFNDQPKHMLRTYRFLSSQFQSPVATQIWHDNITLIIYSENPLLIQIKNDLAVKNYKKYFDILWKLGKIQAECDKFKNL